MSYNPVARLLGPMALALAVSMAVPAPVAAQPTVDGLPYLVERLMPSVVNINMYDLRPVPKDAPPGTLPQMHRKFGSGFIVHETGYIVTNKHVAEDGFFYIVRFADGSARRARLVAEAVGIDLAVMKIEGDEKWPALRIGDSDQLRRGDGVIAIGNPLGWASSVSTGIVSALDRSIGFGNTDNFIQTDAAINQGNSGGPLFNSDGEVIGVNAAVLTTMEGGGSVGLGFAIPINDVKFVVRQLIQFGELRIGYLGIDGESVDAEMAATLGMRGRPMGVIVATMAADGPAAKSGLQVGDVITSLNGHAILNMRGLRRYMAEALPGEAVKLDILRDGKPMAVQMVSAVHPQQAQLKGKSEANLRTVELPKDLGLTLAPMSDALRTQHKIAAGTSGVVVTEAKTNSTAWNRGIRTGDVILRVQGDAVTQPDEVTKLVDAQRTGGLDMVRMLVTGPSGTRWVSVLAMTKL